MIKPAYMITGLFIVWIWYFWLQSCRGYITTLLLIILSETTRDLSFSSVLVLMTVSLLSWKIGTIIIVVSQEFDEYHTKSEGVEIANYLVAEAWQNWKGPESIRLKLLVQFPLSVDGETGKLQGTLLMPTSQRATRDSSGHKKLGLLLDATGEINLMGRYGHQNQRLQEGLLQSLALS